MSNPLRIACFCVLFLVVAGSAHAQLTGKTRVSHQSSAVQAPPPAQPPAVRGESTCTHAAPSNLMATYIGASQIDLAWTAPVYPTGCTLDHYEIQRCKQDDPSKDCNPTAIPISKTSPVPLKVTTPSYPDKKLQHDTQYKYVVVAFYQDQSSVPSNAAYAETVSFTCLLLPTRPACMNFGSAMTKDENIDNNINAYYQTSGSYTFLNQVRSIYNGASGSTTISADLGTLNFANGSQVTVTTNVQAGSSGVTAVSPGVLPTLSSNAAGQATQNMLFGGTFLISQLYPLLAGGASKLSTPGGFGYSTDFVAKEGVDIQNFASGTNINVTNPPFHGSFQMEGLVQYNSINLAPNSQSLAGSLFAGGSYGYSYTSPVYLRDYGFAGKQNNGIGLIVFGIVLNNVAKISVSRGFGPSQTYMDSTTMVKTRVNNFNTWSIGVTYQSSPSQSPTSASKQ
jgi:hypothetical protein